MNCLCGLNILYLFRLNLCMGKNILPVSKNIPVSLICLWYSLLYLYYIFATSDTHGMTLNASFLGVCNNTPQPHRPPRTHIYYYCCRDLGNIWCTTKHIVGTWHMPLEAATFKLGTYIEFACLLRTIHPSPSP